MKMSIPIQLFLIPPIFFLSSSTHAQKPKNGTYTYKVAFAEWGDKSLGSSCTVRIKGDSITVINNGTLSGKKGEVIGKGIIMKHNRTGKWIIGHSSKDKNATEIGGCSDGPIIIDFKRRTVETLLKQNYATVNTGLRKAVIINFSVS